MHMSFDMARTKELCKKVVMFLIGFNILQPTFLLFSTSYYVVARFGFPRTEIGTFVNRTNVSITFMAAISAVIMSLYLLWVAPKFGLTKHNHFLSILTTSLAFVFDALVLIAYTCGGATGNITLYYWALVMTAICLGTNQLLCPSVDPKNIPLFSFGIPVSELRVFFYHVIFRHIVAKYNISNIDFKLVTGQLSIAATASFLAAVLWVYCYHDTGHASDGICIEIERTSNYACKVGEQSVDVMVKQEPKVEGFKRYEHSLDGVKPFKISNLSNKNAPVGEVTLPTGTLRKVAVYTNDSDTALLVEILTECSTDKKISVSTYDYFFFNAVVSKWFGYRINDGQEMDSNTLIAVLTRLKVDMMSEIPKDIVEVLEPTNRNTDFWLALKQGYPFMLMFGLSIAFLCAFYPAIVPYKLIDPTRGYYVDLVNIFIRTIPALLNCVICNVDSLKKYSPQCDWREKKGWRFSWLIFIPYLFAILVALLILHYPNLALCKLMKNNTTFVGILTTMIGVSFVTGRSIGLTALPYQKSANIDPLTGKPMSNVASMNTKLMCSCMLMYYALSVVIIPAGNGYHKAYSKYEHDIDHWPTEGYGFWSSLGFWFSDTVKEGGNILGCSFTTDLTRHMSKN
ncbi:conserved hypothetical protein [Theileria equi strain WA]|uniref:Uncharacterized protein n=1 Tax=Theileria equi strain WA TaxID=1537102 RepID=L1LB36_THEEQ|nr:conserved hypothetical protein [Theileria equi strain WA]EKX72541.1 conserved hypothetical protein [Theileria equi strain WA]|eukprot:XP_004831993.1 conserved hypothetical protein [Theileria equi strain WA]